jgi:hypothetical protein
MLTTCVTKHRIKTISFDKNQSSTYLDMARTSLKYDTSNNFPIV